MQRRSIFRREWVRLRCRCHGRTNQVDDYASNRQHCLPPGANGRRTIRPALGAHPDLLPLHSCQFCVSQEPGGIPLRSAPLLGMDGIARSRHTEQNSDSGNGYLTSEKQAPSPLVLAAEMASAIEIEQRSGKKKLPLRDALNAAVAAYNKNITVTRHRITTTRKNLINNLPLGLLNASPGLTGSLMYLSTLQDIIHHI